MAEMLTTDIAALRRSPLAHLEERIRLESVDGPRGVRLREWPFLTMVALRAVATSSAARRLSDCLGVELPRSAGGVAVSDAHTVLWLGPDEWLLVSPEEGDRLVRRLQVAVVDGPGCAVDVSANRTVLELSGPSARNVLEKGCPADLHPRSFGPGQAVTTTVGPVALVLWQVGRTSYRLIPRSSFADYLARWLLDAIQEYGATEVP
jgi:heterotetrameric sarcosine oxidase gamma subunit